MGLIKNCIYAAILVGAGYVLGSGLYGASGKKEVHKMDPVPKEPVAMHIIVGEGAAEGLVRKALPSAMPNMPRHSYRKTTPRNPVPKRLKKGRFSRPMRKPLVTNDDWRYRKMKELGIIPSYGAKDTQCFRYAEAPPGKEEGEEIEEKDLVWKIATFNGLGMLLHVKPAKDKNIPKGGCWVDDLMTDDMWKAIEFYELGPI